MESVKRALSESLFTLAVLWLRVLQRLLILLGIRREITLPPGNGAAGRGFRVTQVRGMPVLWCNGLPYPTYVDESSHPAQELNGAWKMRFDGDETGRVERWQDTTDFRSEWIDTEIPSAFPSPLMSASIG